MILVGQEERIRAELREIDVPAPTSSAARLRSRRDVRRPAIALRKKRDSSIRVGLRLVADGRRLLRQRGKLRRGDGGGFLILKKIHGIDRPRSRRPSRRRTVRWSCRRGANVESKPAHLLQFGYMGEAYSG